MRWKIAAFYGVDEPENGKRRGECAIQTTHSSEGSMETELIAFRKRDDIGWVGICDMEAETTRTEYMR